MISIIIPVYHVEQYIEDCLKSVVSQSYKGTFECILIDDCGTDASIEIAKHFINQYKGRVLFRILHHEKNQGQSAARNTGINAASGDYLLFLDSDDLLTPDCLETLTALAEGQKDVVCGAYESFDGYLYYWSDVYKLDNFTSNDNHEIVNLYTSGKLYPMPWNKLVKKELITRDGIYFKEGVIHEDDLWNLMVANHAQSFKSINKTTYYYRIRNNSTMTATSKRKSHLSHVLIVEEMEKLLKQGKIKGQYQENIAYIDEKKKEWGIYIMEEKALSLREKSSFIMKLIRTRNGGKTLIQLTCHYFNTLYKKIRFHIRKNKPSNQSQSQQ